MNSTVTRGQIYFVKDNHNIMPVGSEMWPCRPAVIVSNDIANKYSNVVNVVYLTTAKKKNIPTHISVRLGGRLSVAICEQITSVSKERLDEYIGQCTGKEMRDIDSAMQLALSISSNQSHLVGIMKKWEFYARKYNLFHSDSTVNKITA